jgi:hypothetical protein
MVGVVQKRTHMLTDINFLTGILGLLVGILGVAHSFVQKGKITSIKNRNRAFSWGLAKETHRLMAKLEKMHTALQNGDFSLEGNNVEKYKALLFTGYQLSAHLVSKTSEHLVVEYNVT